MYGQWRLGFKMNRHGALSGLDGLVDTWFRAISFVKFGNKNR